MLSLFSVKENNRVFPTLCYIHLIRWTHWIQLEPVKHECKVLKTLLCLSLTDYSFSIMVSMPDCGSEDYRFKSQRGLFYFNYFSCQNRTIRYIFWSKVGKTQIDLVNNFVYLSADSFEVIIVACCVPQYRSLFGQRGFHSAIFEHRKWQRCGN